jgi:tight adherence protein B
MIGPLATLSFLCGLVLVVVGLADRKRDAARSRLSELWWQGRQAGILAPRFLTIFVAASLAGLAFGWALTRIPVLAVLGGFAGGYAPFVWLRRRNEQGKRGRERAWPAALAQLADALEAGLAFPAAIALLGETGPIPLRTEFARMHARLRSDGLAAALEQLAATRERTVGTVALLLRAGVVELPAGGLAPLLRDLSVMLSERFEAREKARTKASSLQLEAAILALSPIVLLLLVGAASPMYLAAYKTGAGTAVAVVGGVAIFACFLLMRRLGRIPEPRPRGAQQR